MNTSVESTHETAAQLSTLNPTASALHNVQVPTPNKVTPLETSRQLFQESSALTVQVTREEYDILQRYKEEYRTTLIDKRVRAMGTEFNTRRNTLIIRRARSLYPDLVKDEEVLAYTDMFKAKERTGEKKVKVTDEEIAAYLALEAAGTTPTVEEVENYVAAMKQNN